MELYGYGTKTFKEIFHNFDDFKDKYVDSPFFYDQEIWVGPSKTTFTLIYNQYCGSHVSMSEEDFINKFENVLYEHFERFEFDIKLKKELRDVSDEVWSEEDAVTQNIATSPNTYGDTDSEMVDSLDNQTKFNTKAGYSNVVRKKFMNNKAYYIKTFLNNFKWLFITILDKQFLPVWLSDSDGLII